MFPYLYKIIWIIMQIMENQTKSMKSACALSLWLKTWKCLSVAAQHLVKALVVSSESTASSVNCVTVSDSVPARKKTKLSNLIDQDQLYWISECICYSKYGKSHKNTEDYKYYPLFYVCFHRSIIIFIIKYYTAKSNVVGGTG